MQYGRNCLSLSFIIFYAYVFFLVYVKYLVSFHFIFFEQRRRSIMVNQMIFICCFGRISKRHVTSFFFWRYSHVEQNLSFSFAFSFFCFSFLIITRSYRSFNSHSNDRVQFFYGQFSNYGLL